MSRWRPRHLSVLLLTALVGGMSGCVIYDGCLGIYGNERVHMKHLAKSCSEGVDMASRMSRSRAEFHCRGTNFDAENEAACLTGIRLWEEGAEGMGYRRPVR